MTLTSSIHKWYTLGILTLITTIGAADRTVVSVIAEPLKAAFRLSDKDIGTLSGVGYSLTYGILVLPMGWLVDRLERRSLLSLAVGAWSALTTVGTFASSFAMLMVARLGVGAAEAPVWPASLSLIADTFPVRQRNTAVGIYTAGGSVGAIVTFLFGAWLLLHFSWRTVFLVAGVPGLVLAALLRFTTREPTRGAFDNKQMEGKVEEVARPGMRAVLRDVLGDGALRYAIGAITIGTGVSYALTVWTTSFLVRVHGTTVSQGATWTGIALGIFMTIGSLVIGPMADRFSRGDQRRLAIIPAYAAAVAVIAGIVMCLADTLAMSLAGLAVLSLMAGLFIAPGYSMVLSLAPPNERGTTMAVTKLISILLGGSLIPWITGAVSDTIGGSQSIRPALLATTTLLLLNTVCYLRIRSILGRRGGIRVAASTRAPC
jgi:MFS family permease